MNEQAMLHVPESKYCFAASANAIVLRLRIAKEDAPDEINVVYGGKYDIQAEQKRASMKLARSDRLYSFYEAKLALKDVRFVYVFEVKEDGKTSFYSEDGLSGTYDFTLAYYNSFQYPYINKIDVHEMVPWMRKAVFYQIFVDRFNRGDKFKDDSYINMEWGEIPNPKSFAGGDIKGITEKIGYLSSLGVNVIYLTPLFKSISNHKYDISDYFSIDPHFGSNGDFRELVDKAHGAGIRVVMDAVFNHCSDRLYQFKDVLEKGQDSKYFDWFIINGSRPDPKLVNYECFGGCSYMPKFNTSNPEVKDYLLNVALHWIKEYDIDGWRLDVSDEVSHDFWRSFRSAVKSAKPSCVIIGENWHDANPCLNGDQFDGIMNYAFTKACLDFFSTETLDAEGFSDKLNSLLMRNTNQVNAMMLNLLDSHDTHRFLTMVEGDEEKLASALAVLFMFQGAPCVYYGTEIAMLGGYDPDSRRTLDWEKASVNNPISTLIQDLAKLKERPEIQTDNISITHEDGLLQIERRDSGKALRLTLNNSSKSAKHNASGQPLAKLNYEDGELGKLGFVVESFAIKPSVQIKVVQVESMSSL
jgi:glycosidase